MDSTEVENNLDNTPTDKKEEKVVTKWTFRKKVWEHLEKNKLANFPLPAHGRIPNFRGSDEAAAKLPLLDEFKTARNIEVNPDKAQEAARMVVLEHQKQLYVPVPRLKDGLLKHITVPEDATKIAIKTAVSRRGIEENGTTINVEDEVQIDLLVVGSVVVSSDGYRIGKGRGYADLEFAVLLEMKAITENTVIITLVHDSQIVDTLPKEIFQPYDVPVDYILTPTKLMKVQNRLPRPKGIIWNILSNRRLNLMPVLQALKGIDEKRGIDVSLKDEDTDVETYEPKRNFRYRRYPRRRPRSEGKTSDSQAEDGKEENGRQKVYPRRRFSRRPRVARNSESKIDNCDSAPENGTARKMTRRNTKFRRAFRKNKPQIDFSLMVSNIEKNVRVRDLKNALNERGIKPNEITWRGYKGFCYLHYTKPIPKPNKEEQPPIVVDNVIEILQNLKICPESENSLSVKIMEPPISRIETTDVTAV